MPSHIGEKEKAPKRHIVIAGSVAGLVSRFVIAPLDVVKIRLQLQPHSYSTRTAAILDGPFYKGIIPTLRKIVAEEGFTALWKGNIPAELLYLTYGATQFLAYRQVTRLITQTGLDVPESAKSSVAGGIAGGIATSATYPFDLLRTRFASQGRQKVYQSLYFSVKHIYQNEGPRGFFRGLGAGITQIVPYMGLFFGTYETTREFLSITPHLDIPPGWVDATSGAFAAVASKTGVFPLDLIRKRLQVQGPTREMYVHRNIPVYNGIVHSLVRVVEMEGWRGLYKGLTVSLVKAAPASAATMWTFERTMRMLRRWEEAREGAEERL